MATPVTLMFLGLRPQENFLEVPGSTQIRQFFIYKDGGTGGTGPSHQLLVSAWIELRL